MNSAIPAAFLAPLGLLVWAATQAAPAEAQGPDRATAPAPSAAPISDRQRLTGLLDEHFDEMMRESPTWASTRGDLRFNDKLEDVGPEAIARRHEARSRRLAELRALSPAPDWTAEDRVNRRLLMDVLERSLDAAKFKREQQPMDDRSNPAVWLPQLADRLRFSEPRHYADYATRLEAVPRLIDQHIANMRAGLAAKRVPPKASVAALAGQCRAQASQRFVDDPASSPFFRPMAKLDPGDPLVARARAAIAQGIVPAFARLAAFVEAEYAPACRDSVAASDSVDGPGYYGFCLREHTTTPLSAQEIHDIGLREVARIRAEMLTVIARTDFPEKDALKGDALLLAFFQYLRTNPRFYHTSADDLLRQYRDIAKRTDAELPRLFGTLPRTPYGVRAIPRFAAQSSPTAYYYNGSARGGLPGYFMANTYRLDQRPIYEMVALTLHEAVPGHHLQIALADELEGLHPVRSVLSFTVFVEGWALYAEKLGLEMIGDGPATAGATPSGGGRGFYADPYDDFGRLTYEMWRASRLVVDTGIHALGWSRQRAIDYMLANTALAPLNIEREVDRYISWPGQATAYKIGELKIIELRRKAEAALGGRFDIRSFHDAVLGSGAVPLAVLEEQVDRWIAAQAGR